jgi:hypothetical protein
VLLEQLYHENTHPSREERERIATAGDMYVFTAALIDVLLTLTLFLRPIRSVTVWFQNKRQLERKVKTDPWSDDAQSYDGVPFPLVAPAAAPEKSSGTFASSSRFNRSMSLATSAFALPPKASRAGLTRAHSLSTLSLDKVVSRRQRPSPPNSSQGGPSPTMSTIRFPAASEPDSPETPIKTSRRLRTILENLPPSPETPRRSPGNSELSPEAARDFVEHGRRKRRATLEWACAAARLTQGPHRSKALTPSRSRALRLAPAFEPDAEDMDGELPTVVITGSDTATEVGDETDEETHEAVTPRGTLDMHDERWGMAPTAVVTSPPWAISEAKAPVRDQRDQEMMAALALCGLGRRH